MCINFGLSYGLGGKMWVQVMYRKQGQKETFSVSANGDPEQVFYNWKDFQAYCIERYTEAGIKEVRENDIRIFCSDISVMEIEGLRDKKSGLLRRIAAQCKNTRADSCGACSNMPCEG